MAMFSTETKQGALVLLELVERPLDHVVGMSTLHSHEIQEHIVPLRAPLKLPTEPLLSKKL